MSRILRRILDAEEIGLADRLNVSVEIKVAYRIVLGPNGHSVSVSSYSVYYQTSVRTG